MEIKLTAQGSHWPGATFLYARDVLKGRWPEAEPLIARDPMCSYLYARDVIKGRFPEGEPAIEASVLYSDLYARGVLKGPWPKSGAQKKKKKVGMRV